MKGLTPYVIVTAFFVSVLASGSPALGEDAVYLIESMRTGTGEARKTARESLTAMGADALSALIEATYDLDESIRWEAVNLLGSIAVRNPEPSLVAIPALLKRAITEVAPHPRWRSLWALSMFPDEAIEELVIPRLWGGLYSKDDQIQWYTTVALAYFRQPDAVSRLNHGLDREDAFDRWEAIYCLGMIHDESSVRLVMEIVVDTETREATLRQEAAMTLGKIGDPTAITALVTALADPEASMRWRAAQALAKLGDPSVVAALNETLAREEDEFAQQQIKATIDSLLGGS